VKWLAGEINVAEVMYMKFLKAKWCMDEMEVS
jgi:hypothetical protein